MNIYTTKYQNIITALGHTVSTIENAEAIILDYDTPDEPTIPYLNISTQNFPNKITLPIPDGSIINFNYFQHQPLLEHLILLIDPNASIQHTSPTFELQYLKEGSTIDVQQKYIDLHIFQQIQSFLSQLNTNPL